MTVFARMIRGAAIAGSLGALVACNQGGSDLLTSTPNEEQALTGGSGSKLPNGVQALTAGVNAVARVRCEKDVPPRQPRSKISVDGNNLNPGRYRARVTSPPGQNPVTSRAQQTVGDEVEFDFDSQVDPGETPISPNYIQIVPGPDVLGEIVTAEGRVVASQAVECEVDN